jgi:hypothetical protein
MIIMAINKKTIGLFSLFVGVILLIVGIFGFNVGPAELDSLFIIGLIVPGILFLVIGIILLALYLHSAT